MKRKTIFITCLVIAILTMVPFTSMATPQPEEQKTTTLLIKLGNEKFEKELPLDTIEMLIEMGREHVDDFQTIYNRYKTKEEVLQAFENLQPYFTALVEHGIGKSVEYLNTFFDNLRDRIKRPIRPQTAGGWNGVPTPVFGNVFCGVTSFGIAVGGIAIGTHFLLPSIGVDIIFTWIGNGETVSYGFTGITTSTGPQTNILFGFVGMYLGIPGIVAGPYFLTGFAIAYAGASPAPC